MTTDQPDYSVTFHVSVQNTGTLPVRLLFSGASGDMAEPFAQVMTVSVDGGTPTTLTDFVTNGVNLSAGGLSVGSTTSHTVTFAASGIAIVCDCSPPNPPETVSIQLGLIVNDASPRANNPPS